MSAGNIAFWSLVTFCWAIVFAFEVPPVFGMRWAQVVAMAAVWLWLVFDLLETRKRAGKA